MSSAGHNSPRDRRARLLRLTAFTLVIIGLLVVSIPALLGFVGLWGITHASCGADMNPAEYGMPDYEAVTFRASALNQDVRAYFVRGTNGATIIVAPTGSSGRGYWRHEVTVLHEHGYSLFNYESRNCLGHANSLGVHEAAEVGDALGYLATRPDVDMERVGITGFSAGGATATFAAARYPAIKAVVAEGGFYDFYQLIDDLAGDYWFGELYRFGSDLSYRAAVGLPLTALSPISVIDDIAPRPILLIYGTREPSLPGARKQAAAAGANAQLWEVPNGTHGSYWIYAPEEYTRRVTTFFHAALNPQS